MFNVEQVVKILNSLTKYSLEDIGRGWQSDKNLEVDKLTCG